MAHIVEYIASDEHRGDGASDETAHRRVLQLWTKQGQLIAEYDPLTEISWFNPFKEIK